MFRHVQERRGRNGAIEQLVTEHPGNELFVGRGGRSQLVIASRQVSLEHAVFRSESGRVSVADLDSLSGVFVNRVRISVSRDLATGDRVRIGEVEFIIDLADGVTVLRERSERKKLLASADSAEETAHFLRKLRMDSYLPAISLVSVAALLAVLVSCFAWPFLDRRLFLFWSSGPVSNSHALIEAECTSCHQHPFVQVRDQACQQCHALTPHGESLQVLMAGPATTPQALHGEEGGAPARRLSGEQRRCAECHHEHNGDHGVVPEDARVCSSCHAQPQPGSKHPAVPDFAHHPEFRFSAPTADGEHERIPLNAAARNRDYNTVRLNHAVHLKEGLRGEQGPVTLSCASCHERALGTDVLKPVNFDRHCRECHSLGFDERLPQTQVPHGEPEQVFTALYGAYARLHEGVSEVAAPAAEPERRMPGGTGVARLGSHRAPDEARIEVQARAAERQIFSRTGCQLCHLVHEKDGRQRTPLGANFTVVAPVVRSQWFQAARFSHAAHEPFQCVSCHQGVQRSEHSTDVLIPDLESCRSCHVQEPRPGFVRSECVLCHAYHQGMPLPDSRKREIESYVRDLMR